MEVINTLSWQLQLFVISNDKKQKDNQYIKDIQQSDQILLNKNSWMDNKLFKISLKDYFEPATGAEQQKKYRLLIIDGHIFHVSNKFIKFIEANNIICICF